MLAASPVALLFLSGALVLPVCARGGLPPPTPPPGLQALTRRRETLAVHTGAHRIGYFPCSNR
jgi:hypothetical protein